MGVSQGPTYASTCNYRSKSRLKCSKADIAEIGYLLITKLLNVNFLKVFI